MNVEDFGNDTPVPDSLHDFQSQRDALLQRLLSLGDFRPGSISATRGRCGKPACPCHQPGHGPHWRLTYKRHGKSVSESLPNEAAQRKAEREIAACREFQQLSHQLLDADLAICRQCPAVAGEASREPLKKRPARSRTKSRSKSDAS